MNTRYYNTIKNLSRLHVIPHYKWGHDEKEFLNDILKGIPYFITNGGNIFLGEDSIDKIKEKKIIFQAHLDHPGGRLFFDFKNKHMYTVFHGVRTEQYLIGRKFGVYNVGNEEALDIIEVEFCHENSNDSVTLYFKFNNELVSNYKSGELIVHFPADVNVGDRMLSNWNLDNLINAALIIECITNNQNPDMYGILTMNEEVGHLGIYEVIDICKNKNLFCLTSDTISSNIETKCIFGIRSNQDNIDLTNYIPNDMKSILGKDIFNKVPYGICEGVTLIKNLIPTISLFIKINNFHNGLPYRQFSAESIDIYDLDKYISFVSNLLKELNNSVIYFEKEDKKHELNIQVADYSKEILSNIRKCENYSEYLSEGLPKLREIFTKHNLKIPSLTNDDFIYIKESFQEAKLVNIHNINIKDLAEKVISELSEIFKVDVESIKKDISTIRIKTFILCNFNACNAVSKERNIFLSLDKLNSEVLERVLVHELVHYLSEKLWMRFGMSLKKRIYHEEGLAVYITAKVFNLKLYESLNFEEEVFKEYMDKKIYLQKMFSDYLNNNLYKLRIGNKHSYFVRKEVINPFYASEEKYPRYGYFLSALETENKINGGTYHELLLY